MASICWQAIEAKFRRSCSVASPGGVMRLTVFYVYKWYSVVLNGLHLIVPMKSACHWGLCSNAVMVANKVSGAGSLLLVANAFL